MARSCCSAISTAARTRRADLEPEMSTTIMTLFEAPVGYASTHVARYMWQLDEQSRRLLEDVGGAGALELQWQPAPGLNTIGMLLAHIAVAEAHLTAVGLERRETSDIRAVLGIAMEDDGLPLPGDGAPPEALRGRELPFFVELLRRARENTRRVALGLTDADLAMEVTRRRPDGTIRVFNVDWVLYHMLEHEAGHHAQVNLLRHLHRGSAGGA